MKNWIAQLDVITRQSLAEFGSLTNEQLNWKRDSNTWSIAQKIDHLIVVNETYFPVLASLKAGPIALLSLEKLVFWFLFWENLY